MRVGKLERLDGVLDDLIISKRRFASCVVTNERGLVVAGRTVDGSSSQTLAAMISLFSDTTIRINENLGYGHPNGASGARICMFAMRDLIRKGGQYGIFSSCCGGGA